VVASNANTATIPFPHLLHLHLHIASTFAIETFYEWNVT
jgi:hypothetical protein